MARNTNRGSARSNTSRKEVKKEPKEKVIFRVNNITYEEYYDMLPELIGAKIAYTPAKYLSVFMPRFRKVHERGIKYKLYRFYHPRFHTEFVVLITRSKKDLELYKDLDYGREVKR